MNVNVGVYNIENDEIVAVMNPNPDAIAMLTHVYSNDPDHALYIKNTVSDSIYIVTASRKFREIRNAITALVS